MFCRFILSTAIIGIGSVSAVAQEFYEDFSDGLGPNWITLDTNAEQPWGPGIYDTSSGSLNMMTTSEVPIITPYSVLTSGFMAGIWAPSLGDPAAYSNGIYRMQFRTDSDADPSMLLRGDPETFTAYDFAAGEGNFAIWLFVGGEGQRLATMPGVDFNQGEDWWMEAAAFGNQLWMKVWKDGTQEPASPQLTITDSTLTVGGFGIGVGLGEDDLEPAIVNATFDDVSFVVPEPASNGTLLLLFWFVRRSRRE